MCHTKTLANVKLVRILCLVLPKRKNKKDYAYKDILREGLLFLRLEVDCAAVGAFCLDNRQ